MNGNREAAKLRKIIAKVKPLACEFYRLAGRPLGVTGEVAEFVAADLLGLTLAPPRTPDYDATRGKERIQIKGRALSEKPKPGQRLGRIKLGAKCHTVMVVLLDNQTLDAREIWEAPHRRVAEALTATESKARARGQLSLSAFKRLARLYGRKSFPLDNEGAGK